MRYEFTDEVKQDDEVEKPHPENLNQPEDTFDEDDFDEEDDEDSDDNEEEDEDEEDTDE